MGYKAKTSNTTACRIQFKCKLLSCPTIVSPKHFPGITIKEKQERKRMNRVSTGFNLTVWIVEVLVVVPIVIPQVADNN